MAIRDVYKRSGIERWPERVTETFALPSLVKKQYHEYCDEHFIGLRQRESMPTPNRAAKRASEIIRPGSGPDQPKRGHPNTQQTPAVERETRELEQALENQLKQCYGLIRSIKSKTTSLKKMVATAEKKASDRKEQIRVLNGIEVSINKKINRLKELNIDRSSDRLQQEDDSTMDINYILSDGRMGLVSMDVDGGVLFNSDLDEGIIHQPADARVRHNDV